MNIYIMQNNDCVLYKKGEMADTLTCKMIVGATTCVVAKNYSCHFKSVAYTVFSTIKNNREKLIIPKNITRLWERCEWHRGHVCLKHF